MKSRTITLATLLTFGSLLQGVHGEDMPKLKSMTSDQFKSPEWVNEIQLSGTLRLGEKGFASLTTPRGNFWVEEGKSSSGYKLIELDTSQSQASALIQKGDRQAWIGFRTGIVPRTRVVRSDELEKRLDDSGKTRIMYVTGESEPFTGMGVWYTKDGTRSNEPPMWMAKSMERRFGITRTDTRVGNTPMLMVRSMVPILGTSRTDRSTWNPTTKTA